MLTVMPDVLCAYVFPQGDFRWARNGAFDAIKSASVPRSKCPWGTLRLSPRLAVLHRLRRMRNTFRITVVVQSWQLGGCGRLDFPPSLRASAHTGVAIRIPLWYAHLICKTFWRTDCHTPRALPLGAPDDIGHWLAMTRLVAEGPTIQPHRTPRVLPPVMLTHPRQGAVGTKGRG